MVIKMNTALTKENDKGSDFTEEWNSIINGIQSFNKHIIEKFFPQYKQISQVFSGKFGAPATDDWHMHNTNGIECFRVMVEVFGFYLDGIRQLMLNGIDACWQPEEVKEQWRKD